MVIDFVTKSYRLFSGFVTKHSLECWCALAAQGATVWEAGAEKQEEKNQVNYLKERVKRC
jgi:hypothetical protein